MNDIVEMLRSVSPDDYGECCEVMSKAAAEIERLWAALEPFACDCTVSERCAGSDNCRNFQAAAALSQEKPNE